MTIRRETLPTGQRLAFAAPPLQRSNINPALLAQVTAALGLCWLAWPLFIRPRRRRR